MYKKTTLVLVALLLAYLPSAAQTYVPPQSKTHVIIANHGLNEFCKVGTSICMPPDPLANFKAYQDVKAGDLNGTNKLIVVYAASMNWPPPPGSNQNVNVWCELLLGSFVCFDFVGSGINGLGRLSYGVDLGDLNGDGNLDAVFSNWGQINRACYFDSIDKFKDANCKEIGPNPPGIGYPPKNPRSTAVALSDLNGDGALDAVFANATQASPNQRLRQNRICWGDPLNTHELYSGSLCEFIADIPAPSPSSPPYERDSWGVAVFNPSSNPDGFILFANRSAKNTVCFISSGSAYGPTGGQVNISCEEFGPTRNTWDVAISDLNLNGLPDAMYANENEDNLFCEFFPHGEPMYCDDYEMTGRDSRGVAIGDFNGDSLPDAIFSNYGNFNQVCFDFFDCKDFGIKDQRRFDLDVYPASLGP